MCIFHKWTGWQVEEEKWVSLMTTGYSFITNEKWKKRTCNKCGYTQRKKMKGSSIILPEPGE